ncbi:hypothetical protein JTB14_028344 [Gonioctena quinquepunctata]|nr:hypothetical protein JTB14_028344 [Gonioctena quinquepunctata]
MYSRLPGEKANNFTRTNSICPTPESVLLELVLKNDRENLQRLVQNNSELLSHHFSDYNKSILLIACSSDQVEAETVKSLIDLDANIHSSNDEEWEAIHFAAHRTDSKILKVVIDSLIYQGCDINVLAQGNNALHILIKFGRSEPEGRIHRMCQVIGRERYRRKYRRQ